MSETQLLERIASDLDFLKKKVVEIEESIEDINNYRNSSRVKMDKRK